MIQCTKLLLYKHKQYVIRRCSWSNTTINQKALNNQPPYKVFKFSKFDTMAHNDNHDTGSPKLATTETPEKIWNSEVREIKQSPFLTNNSTIEKFKSIPNPRQIRTLLDEYIIGQEKLKKILAVAIHNHYQRVTLNSSDHDEVSLDKSNVLLIGPSGTGKTLAAKTIADMLKVPFSINDATSVTQAGYAGDDVESCIARLLQDANYDVAKAERGVVFIDEIDKITRKSDVSNPNQRDVSGEGVQQSLLRILEGTVVNIKVNPGISVGKRPPVGETVAVDTSNILFICSGAFIGLEKIITDRISLKGSIGFGAVLPKNESKKAKESCIHLVEPEDLISYGFIPEFVGRVPVFACTEPLTENELKRILEEPKNALVKQYMKMFKNSDIQLHFHPDAIAKIANLASEKETGARGLRRIMETILQEPLYDYLGTDTKHIVVTPEAVNFDEKVLAFKNTTKANQYLKDNISSERMTPF